MVAKGDRVVVVAGKKVPMGTTGKVFWTGETKYGLRVGFTDGAGTTHWTAMGNVERDDAPVAAPVAAAPAVAPPTLDAKVTAFMAVTEVLAKNVLALEAKVAALEAALAAVTAPPAPPVEDEADYAPFIPDGVDAAEVAMWTR
jgi:hypothetical protein